MNESIVTDFLTISELLKNPGSFDRYMTAKDAIIRVSNDNTSSLTNEEVKCLMEVVPELNDFLKICVQ